MSAIIKSAKTTPANSKTDGYTLTLRNAEGGELRIQGVFINVVKDNSTLSSERITMDQLIAAMRKPDITVECHLIEAKPAATGFFD